MKNLSIIRIMMVSIGISLCHDLTAQKEKSLSEFAFEEAESARVNGNLDSALIDYFRALRYAKSSDIKQIQKGMHLVFDSINNLKNKAIRAQRQAISAYDSIKILNGTLEVKNDSIVRINRNLDSAYTEIKVADSIRTMHRYIARAKALAGQAQIVRNDTMSGILALYADTIYRKYASSLIRIFKTNSDSLYQRHILDNNNLDSIHSPTINRALYQSLERLQLKPKQDTTIHKIRVSDVCFPKGLYLNGQQIDLISAGHDGRLIAWTLEARNDVGIIYKHVSDIGSKTKLPTDRISQIAWVDNMKCLFVLFRNSRRIYFLKYEENSGFSLAATTSFPKGERALSMTWSPLADKYLYVCLENTLITYELGKSITQIATLEINAAEVYISQNGGKLILTQDGKLFYHNNEFRSFPEVNSVFFTSLAVNKDGEVLAAGDKKGNLYIGKIEDWLRGQIVALKVHSALVSEISFQESMEYVASGSYDGTIQIWRLDSTHSKIYNKLPIILEASSDNNEKYVSLTKFNPNGDRIISSLLLGANFQVWEVYNRDIGMRVRKILQPKINKYVEEGAIDNFFDGDFPPISLQLNTQ